MLSPRWVGMLGIVRPMGSTELGTFTLADEGAGHQTERGHWVGCPWEGPIPDGSC